MLTKEQKSILRSEIFKHLDGIVTCPTAYILHEKGILDDLLNQKKVELDAFAKKHNAQKGYLNVALHTLAAQGWLKYDNQNNVITYETTAKSNHAFQLVHLYEDVVALNKFSGNYHPRKFEIEPFNKLEKIMTKYMAQYDLALDKCNDPKTTECQILKHIEGMIVGPTIVMLGMTGMFHKYFMEASFRPEEFHKHPESFKKILDFFTHLGWFEHKNETYRFTEKGLFFARRASAYGVTVSYLPMFRHLDDLLFGDPNKIRDLKPGEDEKHVDRAMNVWGSGGAHSAYFKVVDKIIIDIFNRPIEEQPKGILDMGCGNGAFIQHLFEVIDQKTKRGEMLDEHPLFLVGADYNKAALKVTRANLIKADIWAKVLWGDIGDPGQLADTLQEDYKINLEDLLNVRTFLDHNRIWEVPQNEPPTEVSKSNGAFTHRGEHLHNAWVEQSLVEHFTKWQPYVGKFGLLVIELHTISPNLIAENMGKTAATAYNATHGFSDQYILEIEQFLECAERADLFADKRYQRKFPNSDLATVSINLLKNKIDGQIDR